MYPKNNASPPRLAIGQVVQISDGAIQSSGVTITVRGEGAAEATGGGTTAYGAEGTVYYTPTQAETNYTAFVVIASKASCYSASITVVTTASATAGMVDVGAISGDSTAADNMELDYDGTGYAKANSTVGTATTVTNGVTASTVSDKTGYSISGTKTTLDALNDVSTAEVNTQADLALSDIGLNHLISDSVTGTDITDNSIVAYLVSSSATADWDSFVNTTDSLQAIRDNGGGDATAANQTTLINAIGTMTDLGGGADIANNLADIAGATFATGTDSLEAIRNRGDSAWVTGAGGSDRLLMVDTTIATLSSQTSFTLTAGSTDDDAYNGCTIIIEDVSTSTQKAVGIVDDYTGSTKTVTLLEDPAVFTMAATDKVYVLAEKSLKPTTAADYHIDVNATGTVGIDWGNIDNKTATVDLSATDIQLVDTTTTNTDMRGTDNAALASALATAQTDLNTLTGTDGVTLATSQPNYAPATAAALTTHDGKLDTVDANVDLVLADTAELQGDWVDGGRLDLLLDTASSGGGDATAANQTTLINAIGTMTDLGGGADVANNLADIAGATFNAATDSLEQIHDDLVTTDTAVDAVQTDLDNATDGLGAIKTAVDGVSVSASPLLLKSTTIATLTSQTVFTLTDGSTDDDAYNGMTCLIIDQSDTDQISVATVIDYVGSTKTVTLQSDQGIFTIATGDTVKLLAMVNNATGAATAVVGWLG